ncbi:MAG: Ppx/GppA family phosphatase [Rhodospirillales bacterium]|nr:Ppx/GppA family phosphatase [Rhodospirillales bacterium]
MQHTVPAYGAIDLGTNNCRLLVAVPSEERFTVVGSFSRIVRLGENISSSGKLSDAAMDRTVDALKICAEIMEANGVKSYQAISTEACRRATNGAEFLDRVSRETKINIETITPDREAELTFSGCSPLLDNDKPYGLVFDIGGGSTELMWIEKANTSSPKVSMCQSIPEGVVTLADKYNDTLSGEEGYEELIRIITPWLDDFDSKCGISEAAQDGNLTILGTSGTVTTLGALHLGLKRYDRSRVDGMVIDFESITSISHLLASMTCESRATHPCIGPERADLVVMGCALLEAVTRRWNVGRLRVADRGIREGLLLESMTADGYVTGIANQKISAAQ